MAVFTRVTEPQLRAWLGNYPLGELVDFQGIQSGIENTNYFVTTGSGQFVLTLFEKLTARELPFYLNLMDHLAHHGIPCPAPVADHNKRLLGELNGKPACIVSRLSGKSQMQPDASHCGEVGAMLGRMHIAGQSFSESMADPRGTSWRAQAAQQVRSFVSPQDAALLESEVAFHEQNPLSGLPQGVIHADLFRDNVLLDGTRIGGLIDFYFACTGALLYDVAVTVNDWCVNADGSLDETRARSFLQAYNAVRPLQDAERAAWPTALRVAALRFWISRLYDLHLPRDGEIVNAHNPDQFKRILQRHIAAGDNATWL